MANTKIPVELSSTPGIVDNSNATAITIDSSENVGIGTDSISGRLEIKKATTSNETIFAIEAEGATTTTLGSITYDQTNDSMRLLNNSTFSGSTLRLGTVGSDDVIIDNNGNVGIGTTSVSQRLDVQTSTVNTGMLVYNTNTASGASVPVFLASESDGSTTNVSVENTGAGNMVFRTGATTKAGYGTERMRIDSSGNVILKGNDLNLNNGSVEHRFTNDNTNLLIRADYGNSAASSTIQFSVDGSEKMRIDSSGNLLVGVTSGTSHFIKKALGNGSAVLEITGNNLGSRFFNADGGSPNAANSAQHIYSVGATGRSINAAGTINASGADYAEYMKKSDSCGTITKGDVCGVDSTGKLTDVFADAISFVIKSTNPSYVGGDNWGGTELELTEEQYETERQKYDRIAFSGQVPVNITGSFNVGDYVYPQANGTDIECVAKSSPTFEEYQLCVGKIWATEDDGRPLVAVKIG